MRFVFFFVATVAFSAADAAGNAEKGKTAYLKHGCWQCHGFVGQGGMSGVKLAPNPMPFEAFSAYVRHTNRSMPPYQKTILPDGDLADIHAYLQSIPAAKDYKSIPLLNP